MAVEKTDNQEAVAIIGMACIFPQAPGVGAFWRNILDSVCAIGEPSPEWEAERYLASGQLDTAYGGYLKDLYRFDPRAFGVMPNSIDGGEPDQFLAMRVASDALQDSGYFYGGYDHRDTGIVLGHSTYLHRGQGNLIQHHIILDQTIELLQAVFPILDAGQAAQLRQLLKSKLPQSSANNAAALVPNVMTGRIANRLNLKGPNYIVDAACSSSLLAVSAAIDELRSGRSRLMLAGGVNASLPAEASIIFTQLGALSKSGKIKPFGAGNDGTLLGEGLGVVVLKRLAEAVADRDRIYAVIRGVGISSDGKALGLLAPNTEGEALAIERAYATSGIDPASVELLEAHGTGISLGEKAEISALRKIFGGRKTPQGHIALGSVKSMIGHCIPAAGIAGLIKAALALHHKILPPTLCETVNPELEIERTPFYVNKAARPWIAFPGSPRRAGVDAFGFGGINAHAILEEAPADAFKPPTFTAWPFELCVFSGATIEDLAGSLKRAALLLSEDSANRLVDIAAHLAAQDADGTHHLAMVVRDAQDLAQKIEQASKRLEEDKSGERWATRNGLVYSCRPLDGKLAFMFPGEGSQYLGMFADLALCFDEVRTWFDFWRALYRDPPGESRTDILFPPESELTEKRRSKLEKRLHDMDVGSEAVFIGNQAMHALLVNLGLQPDVMVGHSTGESSALAASSAMQYGGLDQLADFIKSLNQIYRRVLGEGKIPKGALLSVGALPLKTIEEHMAQLGHNIVIAMDNCSNQLVLFGEPSSMETLQKSLARAGGICMPLPFDRGYHTPRFSAMSEAFLDYYKHIGLKTPRCPLYSCASANLFPPEVEAVRKLAAGQWSAKVRFSETVTRMHENGVRYFVEVGPSGNLCAFANDILSGKEHLAIAMNLRRKNGVEQLLTALAHLYVNGRPMKIERLFEGRAVEKLHPKKEGSENRAPGMRLDNTMPVVHLNDADRLLLRELLPLEEASAAVNPPAQAVPALRPQFEEIGPEDETSADRGVMADYFNLMHCFLDQQGRVMECAGIPAAKQPVEAPGSDGPTPFLNSITELGEQHLEAVCRLNVYEDNFLRNHILSGTVSQNDPDLLGLSCVPLMVSLEIMAEACALLAGSTAVAFVENVKASAWIALDENELSLTVRAEAIDADRCKFRAYLIDEDIVAVSADFGFEAEWRAPAIPALTEKRPFRWDARELYRIGMFHGPLFQSIDRIDGWNEQGIDAGLSFVSLEGFFEDNETPHLVLNPVLLDALGQLSAYWIAQQIGTDFNCFPSTIERIELYRPCPQNLDGLTLRARQQPLDPGADHVAASRAWQFECLDGEGQPLLRTTNLVNIFFPVPNEFYQVRRDPLSGWLGYPMKPNGHPNITLWQLPHLSEEFCRQSSGIFLRILAHALLTREERDEWLYLKANVRKRREWLLGRACLKEAVRYWIYKETGTLLYPSDIVVLHDELGAPYVDGWWNGDLVSAPEVSLSHDARLSLAAVTAPSQPVGVDVEPIDRLKSTDLMEMSLAASERALLRGLADNDTSEKLLRMWCAKEAAAKCLGIGLKGNPEKFEVSFLDDEWRLAHVRHEDFLVEVAVDCNHNSIIALACEPSA